MFTSKEFGNFSVNYVNDGLKDDMKMTVALIVAYL